MNLSRSFLSGLSRHGLVSRLRKALSQERHAEADVLVLLAEVDARKLYLQDGYASLFEYCTRSLHLSESVAYARIGVARSVRKFPVLLERLRSGEVHLAGLRLLVPQLSQANHLELLDAARHKTREEIRSCWRIAHRSRTFRHQYVACRRLGHSCSTPVLMAATRPVRFQRPSRRFPRRMCQLAQ